jgi:trans-aconitate 2-methyltransferase
VASEPSRGDWDAATYDRIADPMARWGAAVVQRIPLRGNESVLDAGCGTGRVTELLVSRVPRGRVIALDASPAMLDLARARLRGDRVRFVLADLLDPLEPVLGAPVDAVLSTATFHWIADHDRLFANLASVMRSGAPLHAQCGGVENIASVRAAVERVAGSWAGSTNFATPEETERRLREAGFTDIHVWLQDEPTPFPPGAPFETYLRTVCLRDQMEHVEDADRPAFAREVAAAMPQPVIDYVRLNIAAYMG